VSPNDYCLDRVARRGTSLFYAVFQLPLAKRQAVAAVHAFRREVLEAATETSDPALGLTRLLWWRTQVEAIYSGVPQHPVARALQPVAQAYQLPVSRFLSMIESAEADLLAPRYSDYAALARYCDQMGASTSELTAEILGYRNARTAECARLLGRETLLAGIVRDIGRDAQRNRLRLPADEMEQFSVAPADLIHRRYSEGFRQLVEYQIDRIERDMSRALTDFPADDRPAQRPLLALAAIARTLLREIRADGCKVLDHRITLTPLRKLWIAWRAG
jgi:phytoene synthase